MPIKKEEALEIARRALDQKAGEGCMQLVEDATLEREFGWVFVGAANKYLETGDPDHAIPGFGPIIVHAEDGSVDYLNTSGSPSDNADAYEAQWRERQ